MSYLSIMVSPADPLPQVVCGSCAHKLDEFHTFRELSHKSERLLEQFLQYANSLSGPKEVRIETNCVITKIFYVHFHNTYYASIFVFILSNIHYLFNNIYNAIILCKAGVIIDVDVVDRLTPEGLLVESLDGVDQQSDDHANQDYHGHSKDAP